MLYEPSHYKPYNKFCATSEDSDQPAHLGSLIRVFADSIRFIQPRLSEEGKMKILATLDGYIG